MDVSLDDYSFNVTEQAHELLDRFSQTHPSVKKNSLSAPFKTMKDVFIAAAFLGAELGHTRALDGKKVAPFKGSNLTKEEQLLLQGLAIGHVSDPEILAEPQRVVRIAEEFANSGIGRLKEIAEDGAEEALWNIVNHYLETLSESNPVNPG